MIRNKSIAQLITGCGIVALAGGAPAQESGEIEEIIVTAQNRAENVQDVPIAINVIGSDEIQSAGFSDFREVERIAPQLNVTNDNGDIRITLRGVGTNSSDEAQDTSVVVNVEGEYINRPNVLNASLFDLERVEVLRGPQGTLYGRNSTGGAVNFITRKPGDEFAGNALVSYGNYDSWSFEGGVDLPFGDVGGLRLAGIYKQNDGYFYQPNIDVDTGDDESKGVRASLRLEPTDVFRIDLAVEYSERDYGVPSQAFVDLNAPGNSPGPGCSGNGWVEVAPNIPETLCIPKNTNFLSGIDRENYDGAIFGPSSTNQDSTAIRARLAYDIGDAATLSYISGFRSSSETGFLGLPVIFRGFTFLADTDTQSHELRLNGQAGSVIYQVGAFYFKEELNGESGFYLPGFILPFPAPGVFLTYFTRDVVSESTSVFGQIEVPVSDAFTLVGGLRYTDNKRRALYGDYPFVIAEPVRQDPATLMGTVQNLGNSEDEVTWLAGVNFTPSDDTLIYGKVTTGFKGGGFDSVGSYAPETNTAFEIGQKTSFGDSGQYRINANAFLYDYTDLQVSVLLNTATGGQVFNAGSATIWGIELEGDFALGENDALRASINYLNAEYDELLAQFNVYCVGGCPITGVGDLDPTAPGVQQPNFAGNTPPFSPEFVITAGYDHMFNLANGGTITAGISTRYKTSYYTDFFNYQDGQQEAYTETDVSVEYRPESERFSIQAFARNLEDERPLTFGSYIAAGPDDIYNFQFGTPRIYGIRLGVEF